MSDAAIRVRKPIEKPCKVSDFEGLFLTVRPPGSRLWHFTYRIDGKEKLLSIGAYPDVKLAQARGKKDEARALLAVGKDPGEVKKDQQCQGIARRGNTFEAMARDFIAKAEAEGRASKTQAKTEWLPAMAIASFGRRPITEVTAPMILVCLRKTDSKGNHETAKRLRAKIGGHSTGGNGLQIHSATIRS